MLTELCVDVDSDVVNSIDEIARSEFKSRETVIREALTSYVVRFTEMVEIKRLVTRKFLSGKLSFDDFARVVGYEDAVLIRDMDREMKEGVESAKADFADWA